MNVARWAEGQLLRRMQQVEVFSQEPTPLRNNRSAVHVSSSHARHWPPAAGAWAAVYDCRDAGEGSSSDNAGRKPRLAYFCLWPLPRRACSISSLVTMGALRSLGLPDGSFEVGFPVAVGSLPGKVISTASSTFLSAFLLLMLVMQTSENGVLGAIEDYRFSMEIDGNLISTVFRCLSQTR